MLSNSPIQSSVNTNAKPLPLSCLVWSIGAVLGTAALCGVLGMAVGAALGHFVPGYYQAVFASGSSPEFDPVAVGVGQGLTQGFVCGAIISLVLVALFYWYRSRSIAQTPTA